MSEEEKNTEEEVVEEVAAEEAPKEEAPKEEAPKKEAAAEGGYPKVTTQKGNWGYTGYSGIVNSHMAARVDSPIRKDK